LLEVSIYYTVRHCITPTWLNDRDQFLYPNDGWKDDTEFQNDCFAFTIFNTNIQLKYGVNHWIPFSETEVNAKDNFESHFMKVQGNIEKDNGKRSFTPIYKTALI
jgi:hypothetical protein